MPELLTKHPDVAIQVLRGAEAQCGPGQEQAILKECPPDRFCSTSAGELCVFGLGDLSRMTQITKAELAELVCEQAHGNSTPATVGPALGSAGPLLVAVGLWSALLLRRRRGSRPNV